MLLSAQDASAPKVFTALAGWMRCPIQFDTDECTLERAGDCEGML